MFMKENTNQMDGERIVRSPCVSICALDDDDICIGCHRSVEEIAAWSRMSNEQRMDVLKKVADRERKSVI
ncbi:predicted Fe-S protein [Hahella chejuensis KCTC 2396]|uniref:Predicted Fe-S protein n=2 Tax=Hahella chejuensis TaxID=158327 RepID=Q2SJZ9_HAHCH|nr:predicted Fe-S protein [Hahella chejuensis KCTC 2396]